jgi:hypothetical protein
MLKRHEIEILLKAGHSKIEMARLAGVSLSSVKRIAEEDSVVQVDDAAERVQRRIGRPSIVGDFRKVVVEILQQKADLPSLEIVQKYSNWIGATLDVGLRTSSGAVNNGDPAKGVTDALSYVKQALT